MQSYDLTTLANVKAWLGAAGGTSDDVLLAALISAASLAVADHLERAPLAVTTYTEIHDVTAADFLILRQWPVLSIAAVSFGTTVVNTNAAATWPLGAGYLLDASGGGNRPQRVSLINYCLPIGKAQAQVVYTAGYQVSGEAGVVPSGATHTLTTLQTWIGDVGVSYASGGALTPVTGTPAVGQYSVSAGTYTFAPADALANVLLSYSSPPSPVEQAVTTAWFGPLKP